jgi:D-cysteine desulfhydrase
VVGARAFGFKGQVLGISVASKADDLMGVLEQLSADTAKHLGLDFYWHEDFWVNDDYLGAGYGKPAEPEREAIHLLAQTEGILVDPVYTGRALAGLIDLIRKGAFDKNETVLFWHTGGTAALFAYVEELLSP